MARRIQRSVLCSSGFFFFPSSFISVSHDIFLSTGAAELAGSTQMRSVLWKKSIEKMI